MMRLMKKILLFFSPLLLLAIIATSCAPQPASEPKFRIIAYATEAVIPSVIPYEQLTHINYAFLIPNNDGTFAPLLNPRKLDEIVETGHQRGVKVVISVGGWGWDQQFETVSADPATRSIFIQNLVQFVADHKLDGVDMDWEFPKTGSKFLELMTELRAALPKDKLLTAAVVAYGDKNGAGFPAEAFAAVDFINVMTYDGPDHGSMEQFEQGLDYWTARGAKPEQLVMGVPFYAHIEGQAKMVGQSYAKIVKADPAAAQLDRFDYYGMMQVYNGIPTVQAKTRLALEKASGIMFWTLEQDAPGELSLVKAIYSVVSGK
jgi:GH18 family chitinase